MSLDAPLALPTIVHMHGGTLTLTLTREADLTVVRNKVPAIYVPRRFRIGGLTGISHGAAIVGTPQADGMIAIDVEATPYVDPSPEVWGRWVAEAARRHTVEEEDLLPGEDRDTRLVSEHDLVEVGYFDAGQVVVNHEVGDARLQVWIEAGRAAYMADGAFLDQA